MSPRPGRGRYRVGQHGGGDCVYFQRGDEPAKDDPRVAIAFPRLSADGARVTLSASQVAADIVTSLNNYA